MNRLERLAVLGFALAFAPALLAQGINGGGGGGGGGTTIASSTVAALPGSPSTGALALVTDGNGVSCSSGGGIFLVLCRWSGAAWIPSSTDGSGNITVASKYTTLGTNAGGYLMAQGPTNAVQQVNAVNAIGWQAPTSVTANGIFNLPAATAAGLMMMNAPVSSVASGQMSSDANHSKSLTAQVATIASTALVPAGSVDAAGQWNIFWYMDSTVVCATPGSAGVTLTIGFTDEIGARTTTTASLALGATGATNQSSGTIGLWAASGVAINYSTTYTACTTGTGTYALRLSAVRLQ